QRSRETSAPLRPGWAGPRFPAPGRSPPSPGPVPTIKSLASRRNSCSPRIRIDYLKLWAGLVEPLTQRFPNFGGRDALQRGRVGAAALVGRLRRAAPQHLNAGAVGAVAGRVRRTEQR